MTGQNGSRLFFTSPALLAVIVALIGAASLTSAQVNQPPLARTGVVTTSEGVAVSALLPASDPDGDALTFAVASAPTLGTVVVTDASNGAFTFTPNPGAMGYDTFTFEASDGEASSVGTQMIFIVASTPRWPGETRRVSVASGGTQANSSSLEASLSADGRYVAFSSFATTLVAGDTNGTSDVFVHDRQTGETRRVSVASNGTQGNSQSNEPSLSADGRYVAFSSVASTLVAGDTNGTYDVFVHDRQTGETQRVSVASNGAQGNGESHQPSLSADGRYVAFPSVATTLVAGDTNGTRDVFVHDRQTGETRRVSVASDGTQGNGSSGTTANATPERPSLSADGRYVAFSSNASTLVAGDSNGALDVFVHDRQTGETQRVSVAIDGTQGNGASDRPSLSADGRYVAFSSLARTLVPGGTSGPQHVFVKDRQTGETGLVSVSSNGTHGNSTSIQASLSADGRYVAFASLSSTLVAGDTNVTFDVFVHDRQTGETRRVSVARDGTQGNGSSQLPSLSADGRSVAFQSDAALVAGDTNNTIDVFVVGIAPPSALDGALTTVEDTQGTGTLNGSDPYGDPLTYAIVSNGMRGTAVITDPTTGTFVYTPNGNANGSDTFTFKVNDGTSDSNVATVTVTITPVNDAPVATDQTATTAEDAAQPVTLSGSDVEGDPLAFSIVTGPSHGVLSGAAPSLIYTPAADYNGNDSFTFTANDGLADSQVAIVTIEITPVNDAPAAAGQSVTTAEDGARSVTLTASDVDGDPLIFSIVAGPSHGVLSGPAPNLTYTPAANYNGSDSFTFRVNDGTVDSNVATVSITITALNDAPVAQNGTASVFSGGSVTGTLVAGDIDSPSLSYALVANGTKGSAVVNASTGGYTYTSNAGTSGTDAFTFKANDGSLDSNVATITVTIAANRPPVANSQSLTTLEDKSANGTLGATDADGNRLTFSIVANGSKGTATISNTSTGRFAYIPSANANGTDTFTFKANDGMTDSNVATVTVSITPVNDPPVAQAATLTTLMNTAVNGTLIAVDVDGNPLTYAVSKAPRRGTITALNPSTGAFTYTPAAGFTGSDSFTFKASDGSATSMTATVTITVQ
jgi:VCBS repeat-containing protein